MEETKKMQIPPINKEVKLILHISPDDDGINEDGSIPFLVRYEFKDFGFTLGVHCGLIASKFEQETLETALIECAGDTLGDLTKRASGHLNQTILKEDDPSVVYQTLVDKYAILAERYNSLLGDYRILLQERIEGQISLSALPEKTSH